VLTQSLEGKENKEGDQEARASLRQHFATEELEHEGTKDLGDNAQPIDIYDEKNQGKKLRSLSHSNSFNTLGNAPKLAPVNSRNVVVASTVNGTSLESLKSIPQSRGAVPIAKVPINFKDSINETMGVNEEAANADASTNHKFFNQI
jgi:hypothetical protein